MRFSSSPSPLRKGDSSRTLKPRRKMRVGTGVELGGGTVLGAGQTVTYSAPDGCKRNSIRMHKLLRQICKGPEKNMSSNVNFPHAFFLSFNSQKSRSYLLS